MRSENSTKQRKFKQYYINLMSKSKKAMKFDFDYYLRGGFWLTLANVLTVALSLLLSVIFANFTSKTFYGQYKFALSVFSLLTILALPGMDTAILQSIAKGYNRFLLEGVREKLKWSLLSWPIIAIIALYLLIHKNNSLGWAFLLSMPLFTLGNGFANNAFFMGRKQFRVAALSIIGQSVLLTSFVAGALFCCQNNIVVVVTAYLGAQALFKLIVFLAITKLKLKEKPIAQQDNVRLIAYGKHLTAISVISKVADSLDRLLLAYFLGFQGVAIYAIAKVIPEAVKGLHKQIGSLALPRLTAAEPANVYIKIRAKLLHVLILGGITSVALMLALPFAIPIIYSAKYEPSIIPAEILSLSIFLAPLNFVLVAALTSQRKAKELYCLRLATSGTRILLLSILVPLAGVSGAALSLLLSRVVNAVYGWYALRKIASESEEKGE
jgi:O-antigen/teichoic acid export membrane protein